jgi:hypothetical protein
MTQADAEPSGKKPSLEQGAPRKDIWDKLSALTTLISSVVIGAAGVAATYVYNNKQLDISHSERLREQDRLDTQTKVAALVEHTKRLEALYKFISSENARERAFGYAMFVALGEEPLATKIIATSRDRAGADLVEGIVRGELKQYQSYLESIGFSGLQGNVRLIAFAEDDLETTVPAVSRSAVASAVKLGVISLYYDGVMFVRNDYVDRPFVPLREYTHYALSQKAKGMLDQTSIESGLADYYPASFLDLSDTSINGPAKIDLSFLEDESAEVSSSTIASPISVVYQGRVWAASFWECRKKLSRSVTDSVLLRAWVESYQQGGDKGAADRFRHALLTLPTKAQASCFQDAFKRRGLLKS